MEEFIFQELKNYSKIKIITIQMGIVKPTIVISIGLSEYFILIMVYQKTMHNYLINFSTI